MEENEEIVVNDEVIEEESGSGLPDPDSTSTISDEQIVNAIREIIEDELQNNDETLQENGNEPLNLLESDTPVEENSLSDNEVIDYTELLNDIQSTLESNGLLLQEIVDYNSRTIFDTPLDEYTINESILTIGVSILIATFMWHIFEKFIPKLGGR